jgi:putative MATE family efflux protein
MKDLTTGKILPQLLKLALPIMGTMFMQLAYNITDLIWVGRLSKEAMAAVGIAGFVTWMTVAFVFITKVGSEVVIAQHIGRGKHSALPSIGAHAITLSALMSALISIIIIVFMDNIVGFFRLSDVVNEMCKDYLFIVACAVPLWMFSPTVAGIYNGTGNSKTPFYVSAISVAANIILDPIMIFGLELGVRGAALATAFSILIGVLIFTCFILNKKTAPYPNFIFFTRLRRELMWPIIRVGGPMALQSSLFAIFTSIVSRITATTGGDVGVAVQSAGSQIESLSWTTASGIATALGTYIGQNFGARKGARILKSYFVGGGVAMGFGLTVGLLFFFFSHEIFAFFAPAAPAVIEEGARYLAILGISQLFTCAEITGTGAFNGLGRSYVPASVAIFFNASRIPLAFLFAEWWGLTGIWWVICLTAVGKGAVLGVAFPFVARGLQRKWGREASVVQT